MIKISSEYSIIDGKRLLKISIPSVNGKCYIEFRSANQLLDILSTSQGYLDGQKIVLSDSNHGLYVVLEYPLRTNVVDCLLSYINDIGDIVASDVVSFSIQNIDPNTESFKSMNVPGVIESTFAVAENNIKKRATQNTTSKWKVFIDINDEIILKVIKWDNQASLFCIGLVVADLMATDLIFRMDNNTRLLNLPIEVIKSRFNTFSPEDRFGCFELSRPDFHSIDNTYYKTIISNTILLKDVPQQKINGLDHFNTPLGTTFDRSWDIDRLSGLPIRSMLRAGAKISSSAS